MNVSNLIKHIKHDWGFMIFEKRQGAQQNVAELCRAIMSPPWGVTEHAEAQTIVARPPPVVTRNSKKHIEA